MCKEKEITVLKVSPHKKPEAVTLKNELSALQEAVSSGVKDYHHLIQLVGVEEGVDLLLNDEGDDAFVVFLLHFAFSFSC